MILASFKPTQGRSKPENKAEAESLQLLPDRAQDDERKAF